MNKFTKAMTVVGVCLGAAAGAMAQSNVVDWSDVGTAGQSAVTAATGPGKTIFIALAIIGIGIAVLRKFGARK